MIPFSFFRNLQEIIDKIYLFLKQRVITKGLINKLVQTIIECYDKTIFVFYNLFDNKIGQFVKSIKSDLN